MSKITESYIQRAKSSAVGGSRKRCGKGKNCSATCIDRAEECIVDIPWAIAPSITKVRNILDKKSNAQTSDYSKWNPVAQGNYGKVSINPEGTRAVKELLTGKDGKKGEFGTHEIDLAKKMGEKGHSPKIYSTSDKHIEMDVAKGSPLWKDYRRGESEPRMNAEQAIKAANAIKDLHKMGFFHGDMHALQFLVDGNNVKLVDYGLSGRAEQQPSRLMQDLSKISGLVNWKNPDLANEPYFKLVNKYLDQYKSIEGTSQSVKSKRTRLGQDYLNELDKIK